MHRLRFLPALVLAVAVALCPPPVRAQENAAEIALWTAAAQDDDAASYQAYLDTFPNGKFAALARLRLARLQNAPPRVPAAPAPNPGAWVRSVRSEVRFVDGVVVDVDAEPLRYGSNWRLAVVPAAWPDGPPPDMARFLEDSLGIAPARAHVTVPSGPAGADEVRLYWIPRELDHFVVAASARVTVGPGVPSAVLMRDLGREAARLGPLRFEAAHRATAMLIQASFLRVRAEAEWDTAWFRGTLVQVVRPTAAISVGQLGAAPDRYGSLGEGVCLIDVGGPGLDRVAAMQPGDPVLLRAVPTSWMNASPASPVLLAHCELVQ